MSTFYSCGTFKYDITIVFSSLRPLLKQTFLSTFFSHLRNKRLSPGYHKIISKTNSFYIAPEVTFLVPRCPSLLLLAAQYVMGSISALFPVTLLSTLSCFPHFNGAYNDRQRKSLTIRYSRVFVLFKKASRSHESSKEDLF